MTRFQVSWASGQISVVFNSVKWDSKSNGPYVALQELQVQSNTHISNEEFIKGRLSFQEHFPIIAGYQ